MPKSSENVRKFQPKGSSLAWFTVFEDEENNRNFGFDDPTNGLARIQLLNAVLTEIGNEINASGSVTLLVRNSTNNGDSTGGFEFASGGTFFTNANGLSRADSQISIIDGLDPFPDDPDVVLEVDFGFNYNESITELAGAGEYDLYSKLKSAIIGGMGAISLATSTGGSSSGGTLTRTQYDTFLTDSSGNFLFSASTGVFSGTSAQLIGGSGGVFLNSTNAVAAYGERIKVLTPNPFVTGVSLISWDPVQTSISAPSISGSLLSAPTVTGVSHRELATWECGLLQDLGYAATCETATSANDVWMTTYE